MKIKESNKWEYIVFTTISHELGNELSKLGEDGWELVSTHHFRREDKDYSFIGWAEFEVQCVLKRPCVTGPRERELNKVYDQEKMKKILKENEEEDS